MDLRYEAYCFADRLFYDVQSSTEIAADDFSQVLPELPADWARADLTIWRYLQPAGAVLPRQGWKIHVSATVGNAGEVLLACYEHLVARRIPFKYLRTRSIVLARNSKYAPREASGKLITIYPADEAQLEKTLRELDELLAGQPGAYILSDLRYAAGPLFVRYGGFVEQWLEVDGRRVLAIEGATGELVPDQRKPTFWVPDWITLPKCLEEHLAARKGGDADSFPYRVTQSLHFSNGGGVYRATRKSDGADVVLKEARPHAGLDRDNVDAVARLRREHDILTLLSGVPGVPAAHELFSAWEHEFFAMQPVPGRPIGQWLGQHYPLTHYDVGDLSEYTARALAIVADVERIVADVHARGVVFSDLHPLNVLVDDDDAVSLIDFELAFRVEEDRRPTLGSPGFQAPPDRSGFEIDDYALAALRLYVFLPLNAVIELSPAKLRHHVEFIRRRFGLPDDYCDRIVEVLTPRVDPPVRVSTALDEPTPDWAVVRKSIAAAILASATPQRHDRLFPGDVEQFEVGGACFAYGAAGVLHALDVAGEGRFPEHERWLLDSLRRDPPKEPGFYTGAHGIAHVLENFGYHDEADELVREYAELLPDTKDHGLNAGLSGVALNLLHFAVRRDDESFADRALDLGDRLVGMLADAPPPGDKARAGLLHGWSGPALLFTRLHELTGERRWLDHAERALERDLAECMTALDGSTQVRDGTLRTLPYVGIGSAGIALALDEFARVAPDAACSARLPELVSGLTCEFVIQPAFMVGRAGLLATLAQAGGTREAVDRHLSALAWHAVPYQEGLAFPGVQLRRLSMDLNTGGAGVLLALASAVDGVPALPFLTAPALAGRLQ
ncbi:class III lanthionine synthetase LanKC [Actinosynnema sp. NPDC047251]|uniref:Serine/threonine protein kinase n=1 Tax=Saccharothrix espanaensis (strain ATCC 51144 / DSM 44229 / JCM 9112 / NBRC 15066 / NRRL 15764) TaxID=1179773 RepID=K0JXC7_SACES|nr:class III lanthionine synthetase LanKC [Saccharothrix espanaensis]CCH28893.1 Serine/threonine protein kinase [Saccharothrix espanaensis DSM 44229]